MLSAIAVVLVLGGLIFFHELGHFIVARSFGVGVQVFSLGFGPRVWGFKKGKTDYRLAAIPLGGYVSMVGEQPDEDLPEGFTVEESFTAKAAWKRGLIAASGPVFNFLLAFFIYWGLFMAHGQYELLPTVGKVMDDSPAMEAGFQKDDRILSIDGKTVTYWPDVSDMIAASGGNTLSVEVERGNSSKTLSVTPRMNERKNLFGESESVPMIGIQVSGETVAIPLGGISAAGAAVSQTWDIVVLTFQGIIKLIERVIPLETVGGPIMIAELVGKQAQQGISNLLALAALISINLGILNLLPIPVLDGGHILFYTIETITGKPLSQRVQAITIRIGIGALLALMVLATYNDITRLLTSP